MTLDAVCPYSRTMLSLRHRAADMGSPMAPSVRLGAASCVVGVGSPGTPPHGPPVSGSRKSPAGPYQRIGMGERNPKKEADDDRR